MSRKHNTKHPDRGLSNYKSRLQRRGLNKAPSLIELRVLKARQGDRFVVQEQPPENYAGWDFAQIAQETDLGH